MKRLFYMFPAFLIIGMGWAFYLKLHHKPYDSNLTQIGQRLPDVTFAGVGGTQTLNFSKGVGRPCLVNIYASWSPASKLELPVLLQLAKEHGLLIYGLNFQEEMSRIQADLRHSPYKAVGRIEEGRAAVMLGMTDVPESFLLGANGEIRYHFKGPLRPADIREIILPILEETV